MVATPIPITHEDLRAELQHYATKADLSGLETRLTKQVGDLETRLVREMTVHLRWMIGLYIVGVASIAALMKLLGS